MLKKLVWLAVCAVSGLTPTRASAQPAVLLAVSDAAQLSELKLAKVMVDDSSLWLSVRLQGKTRLALVTAEGAIEAAPAADAWLRALDFATRVRVAAPLGPLSSCGALQQFEPDDTGLPEAARVAASEISSEGTELDLLRRLAEVGLPADAERIAQFASFAQAPFRIALYDVPTAGGSTETLRLLDRGHPTSLPRIVTTGARTVSLELIALGSEGVQLQAQESADPSEFPVTYRAIEASSDYLSARNEWLAQNPTRWLNEAQATAPLFTGTVLPSGQRIGSVISRYFAASRQASASACEAKVRAANERASTNFDDFTCDGADDLARSLTEVGFAELRSSRFFGRVDIEGPDFRVVANGSRSSLLFATEFDTRGCPSPVSAPVSTPIEPTPPPMSTAPVVVSAPSDPYYGPTPTGAVYSEGSCTGSTSTTRSNDSCSGDTSTSESRRDSCSGDTSTSESSSDSCSGDTSTSESSGDSCNSGSSSRQSSGDSCGGDSSDSEYDGDTCMGDSAESTSSGAKKRTQLGSSPDRSVGLRSRPRPRHVRLSLVTLLAAALALPLRRRSASR